jgi:hypothetical protein
LSDREMTGWLTISSPASPRVQPSCRSISISGSRICRPERAPRPLASATLTVLRRLSSPTYRTRDLAALIRATRSAKGTPEASASRASVREIAFTWSRRLRTWTATWRERLRALSSWIVFWSSSSMSRLRDTRVKAVQSRGTTPTSNRRTIRVKRMRPRRFGAFACKVMRYA